MKLQNLVKNLAENLPNLKVLRRCLEEESKIVPKLKSRNPNFPKEVFEEIFPAVFKSIPEYFDVRVIIL